MKIEILGWTSNGIRGGDMEVDLFKNNQLTKGAIIVIDSGCGKTTVHDLIRFTLGGQIQSLSNDEVKEYSREPKDPYYKEHGYFELRMRFDSTIYKFIVNFDFTSGEKTIITEGGKAGNKNKWSPPLNAREFLKQKFVNIYVYDGEKSTKSLLDKDQKFASTTIDTIYQLDHFDTIKDGLDKYFNKEKEKSFTNKSSDAQLTKLDNKINELKDRKAFLNNEIKNRKSNIENLKKNVIQLENEKNGITETSKQNELKLNSLKLEIVDTENKINSNNSNILNFLKKPISISKNIENVFISFKDNLEKLKIPEHSSKAFFDDIIKEPECICGEKMTPQKAKKIVENSKNYMGSEYTNFFAGMKEEIKEFQNSKENFQELLNQETDSLKDLIDNLHSQNQEKYLLEQLIKTDTGRSFEEIESDIEEKQKEILTHELFIEKCNKDDIEISESTPVKQIISIPSIEKLIKELSKQLNLSKELNSLKIKCEAIKETLEIFKEKSKSKIKDDLKNKMNQKLIEVITEDEIQIDSLDEYVKLQSGISSNKKGSEGQNLSLAYVFLNTALNYAEDVNKFPLIIDSPAGKTGSTMRENFAEMLNTFSSQYVVLLQTGEIKWFAEALHKLSNGECYMLTIFKKTKQTEHYLKNEHINLENSAMVEGFEFLNNFEILKRTN